MALTTQDYKAKGTALFASGDYIGAAQEFSHAIKSPVGKKNPVLYSNRAACYHALGA
jgi:Flp pilus assembly protein TadD